jgi:hypothetical protein
MEMLPMSLRRLGVLFALFLTPAVSVAQTASVPPGRNALYLELLGNGGLYSLNYDRRIADRTTVRVGIASWTAVDLIGHTDAETKLLTFPLLVNFVGGSGNHHPELGGGLLLGRRTESAASGGESTASGIFNLTGVVGYRYQGRGVVFRAGITPIYSFAGEDAAYPDPGFFPSIGMSLGYPF